MKKGICLLPLVPVRKEASEMSELVTQVLFGETLLIQDEATKWFHIRLVNDNYEGWVDRKMIEILNDSQFSEINQLQAFILSQVVTRVFSESRQSYLLLPAGSIIRGIHKNDDRKFNLSKETFTFDTNPLSVNKTDRLQIIDTASQFLNAPYLWGGKTIFGIDCSGFTQLVMKINGKNIPRDARQQVEAGDSISFISESQPGDLAFFDNENGEIVHTGIITGKDSIIHASGMVRVDRFDHQGIFNSDTKQYTHKLRLIKKYF
jgi:gamma-D-glutamyl-L-lysine dipeptidyl-peptidase